VTFIRTVTCETLNPRVTMLSASQMLLPERKREREEEGEGGRGGGRGGEKRECVPNSLDIVRPSIVELVLRLIPHH
jgi:hypothetical protein